MAVMHAFLAGLILFIYTCCIFADKPDCPPVRRGQIGTCIQECNRDDDCGSDSRCCSNGCGKVCVGDTSPRPCPPVSCPLGCWLRKKNPTDKCPTCSCDFGGITNPRPALPTGCPLIHCPFGCISLKIDPRDKCETCYCPEEESTPAPIPLVMGCPAVVCPSECMLLKAKPSDRCKTCYCHEEDKTIPGLEKENPGRCPRIRPGQYGTCVHQCNFDKDCGFARKCCGNGCGQVCVRPRKGRTKRSCPTILPGQFGICVQQCSTALDCPGRSSMCCSNGCGRICV